MRSRALVLPLAALALAAAGPREMLGAWGRWAAFRAGAPPRCHAVTAPVARTAGATRAAFAAVLTTSEMAAQPSFRLSRPRDPAAGVRLTIDRRWAMLPATRDDAWPRDAATDRVIVAAMRTGLVMRIESRDPAGRPFRDVYRLDGAASAIDAAILGCLRWNTPR